MPVASESQPPERTERFAPTSQLRRPRQFFRASALSLRASFPLARRLFVRDIRARYRLSVLGFAWIVLPAIAQTGVWIFLNASQILNSGDTDIPLPLFILIGTLLWQGFTDGMFAPGNQLSSAGPMLSRVNFPAESLLLAGLADAAVNTFVRLLVAIPLLVFYRVIPGAGIVLFPFGVLSLLLLGFSIGLAIAPFGMLYQDLSRFLVVATGFWLLVTPVAYNIPTSGPGRLLTVLNPVSPLLVTTRDWMTGGGLAPSPAFVAILALSMAALGFGWVLFRLSLPHLIDRIGS